MKFEALKKAKFYSSAKLIMLTVTKSEHVDQTNDFFISGSQRVGSLINCQMDSEICIANPLIYDSPC